MSSHAARIRRLEHSQATEAAEERYRDEAAVRLLQRVIRAGDRLQQWGKLSDDEISVWVERRPHLAARLVEIEMQPAAPADPTSMGVVERLRQALTDAEAGQRAIMEAQQAIAASEKLGMVGNA